MDEVHYYKALEHELAGRMGEAAKAKAMMTRLQRDFPTSAAAARPRGKLARP